MTDKPIRPEDLEALKGEALEALGKLAAEGDLAAWKTRFLGKTSPVMQAFARLIIPECFLICQDHLPSVSQSGQVIIDLPSRISDPALCIHAKLNPARSGMIP